MPALMLVYSPDTSLLASLLRPEEGPVYVGREPRPGGAIFNDSSLSREHFRLSCDCDGNLEVEDLNSTNGLLVGRHMMRSETVRVSVGQVLRAGDSIWVVVSEPNRLGSPEFWSSKEDRLKQFEDVAHQWTDELMYSSVDIPYSIILWDDFKDLEDFESLVQLALQSLRPMEVLDASHLGIIGVELVEYGAGQKRTKPNKDELRAALLERSGSIRATAEHYNVQRTQVYRWIRSYEINIDEIRNNVG